MRPMKHLKYLILALGLSVCEPLMAQGGLFSLVKKVGTMIDSMSVKGVDRRYIDAPEKPWQFNNIRYHHNSAHGYLNDWFVNASIGIRL